MVPGGFGDDGLMGSALAVPVSEGGRYQMRRSSDSLGYGLFGQSLPFPIKVTGVVVCLVVSLSACETPETGTGQGSGLSTTEASAARPMIDPPGPIGASPLPRATVGDSYVFDNPRERWTVESVEDDRVTWKSDQGARRVTSTDPLMPSIESAAPGVGEVTRIVQSQTGTLWPLAVGNESSFVVAVGMEQPPYSQSLAWNCRVVGVSRIEVPAGTFNTHKVACARSDGLRLNTYHSPTVGYFVKREVTTADQQSETRSLLAFNNAASAAVSPHLAGAPPPSTAPAAPAHATPLAPPADPAGGGPSSAQAAPSVMVPPPSATPAPSATISPPVVTAPRVRMPAPAPAPASAAPAGSGGWTGGAGVRLASFRTAAAAQSGWTKLQATYPAVLGSLSPRIVPVNLGAQGTYHRLYAGPFSTAQQARGVCGKIQEMGSVCDVKTF